MGRRRQIEDKLNIREAIERYFFGVDARDRDALIGCFSADAEASYHWATPEQKTIIGGAAICDDVFSACSTFTSSTHCIANLVIDNAAEIATADTFAVAYVIRGSGLVVRGLRYQDHLVRAHEGWLISRRKHTPMWQTETVVQAPKLF